MGQWITTCIAFDRFSLSLTICCSNINKSQKNHKPHSYTCLCLFFSTVFILFISSHSLSLLAFPNTLWHQAFDITKYTKRPLRSNTHIMKETIRTLIFGTELHYHIKLPLVTNYVSTIRVSWSLVQLEPGTKVEQWDVPWVQFKPPPPWIFRCDRYDNAWLPLLYT